MRVTIIRDDNSVSVDGEHYTVDCSGLPEDFHALQWDGASGEIEYRMTVCEHCHGRNKEPNLRISDLTPYRPYVDAWTAAKAAAAAAMAEAKARAATRAAAAAAAEGRAADATGPQA